MKQKTYNYILFDWDGTLAQTLPIWFEAHRITLATFGINISRQDVIEKMLVQPKGLKEFNITHEDYFTKIVAHMEEHYVGLQMHNDAIETIEELRARKKKVAIVTSMGRKFIENTLQLLNFTHLFDTLVGFDDVTHLKPHPEPIYSALELIKGNLDETLMIGDSDADIGAAKAAGVTSVWFHPPENLEFYPHGHWEHLEPDFTIRSMKELLDIVK